MFYNQFYIIIPMNPLTQKQIKTQELSLLEHSGYSLRDFSVSNHRSIFNTIHSSKQIKQLRRISPSKVRQLNPNPNANIQAFSWALLETIFKECPADDILHIFKSTIFSLELERAQIQNFQGTETGKLSQKEIKKLLIEFIFQLTYSNSENKVEAKISRYPIILDLMTIIFRKLMVTYQIPHAEDYNSPISSLQGFKLLIDYFDLNCKNEGNMFLFYEDRLFIYVKNEIHVIIGRYGENKSQKRIKTESNCFQFDPSEKMNRQEQHSLNNIHMAESLIVDGDADTPSFYFEQEASFKSSRVSQNQKNSDIFDSVNTNKETSHPLKTNDLKKSMKESQIRNFGENVNSNRNMIEYQLRNSMEKITSFDKIMSTPPTNDYPIELSYQAFNFISPQPKLEQAEKQSEKASVPIKSIENEDEELLAENDAEEDQNVLGSPEEKIRLNSHIYDINIECFLTQDIVGRLFFQIHSVSSGLSGQIYQANIQPDEGSICPSCKQAVSTATSETCRSDNAKPLFSFSKKQTVRATRYQSRNRLGLLR